MLKVYGAATASGLELDVPVIVDTGFSEAVALPPDLIAALALPPAPNQDEVEFGNGTTEWIDLYMAKVFWDGQIVNVKIHALINTRAVGMKLLRGYNVSIDGDIGGQVTITAKP